MQAISEPISASSPPFILNSDMSGADSDPDFEFLDNSHMPFETTYNPNTIFEEFSHDSPPYYPAYATPSVAGHKSPEQPSFLNTAVLQAPLSAPSTASPAGSSHSSTSDSMEYNRKSSSDSSRSALNSGAAMMGEDIDMGDWKGEDMIKGEGMSSFGDYAGNGTINPSAMVNNFGFNDKSMENDFDFDSASSSPSPFAITMEMESPEMPTIKQDTPRKISPMVRKKFRSHNKSNSQHSVVHSSNGYNVGSRETSPLSVASTSQASSPAHHMFTNSPSPNVGLEFMPGIMPNAAHGLPPWTNTIEMPPSMTRSQGQFNPLAFHNTPQYKARQNSGASYSKPILTIHPTPLKSRVETQIPIKMTLFPMPQGVTKLHLPTQTISKPKLLVKPPPERSPDTLELYTMLVCSSAIENPDILRKALERAAAPEVSSSQASDSGSDEDDDRKPLNGGEVLICSGCITRERKRAARKKVKKVEEEESWHKDEAKRVIVFNTHEVKDWQSPTSQPPSEATGDRPEPIIPDGAMQVDAPMRIACYCRHQNEKIGFRVIFTIKDYQDRLIAQAITSSIMITDDHKTHNLLPISGQVSGAPDGQVFPGSTSYSNERNFDMPTSGVLGMQPFRVSPSASDLQNLPQNFMPYPQPMNYAPPNLPQAISATMTPRHPSPQASPSTPSGAPLSKKRKASSSGKVPSGLAMTKLETGQPGMNIGPLVPVSAATSTIPSPFTPNIPNFPPNEQPFCQPAPPMQHIQTHFNTGPPTPNSNDQLYISPGHRPQPTDNLPMHQLYSAPPSAHPSRAPSPNGMRNNVQMYQQQQQHAHMAQAVANGIYGMPLTLSPQRPPVIHKLIPNEGPKAGGIEVTCLGSGFCQGLEVMFGDAKATTTTFWGETSLVCLLPPSAIAGTVPVTFKHQHQQRQQYPTPPIPKQTAFFKYVDDDEQQIIRTALAVLGHKMTGKMEDVRDLARRIVDGPWGAPSGQSPPSAGGSSQHGGGFNAASFGVDVEATLLRCLDLIDLDDSPTKPRFNLRRTSGQTMLHLACSLGLHRFVAALLARGVNCEPRDKGGFTPMHFAALHNHPQIVRRLILGGADPLIRSLQGYAPADMTSSEEVHRAVSRVEHHSRTRSGSSLKSRTSSATSLRSLWQPPNAEIPNESGISDSDDEEDDNEYEDEDADVDVDTEAATNGTFRTRSRQSRESTTKKILNETIEITKAPVLEHPEAEVDDALASPTMAMTAFRDHFFAQVAQVTAQMQHLQQSFHNGMHLGLPTMPQMPTLANLPDYQAYLPSPMARRISSRPESPSREDGGKEQGNKWWDLFSGNVAAAPPAYEDIFPQNDMDVKRASAEQAVADTIADNKCTQVFDQLITQVETTTSSARAESSATATQRKPIPMGTLRIGGKVVVTVEQQNQIQLLRQEKLKRIRSDRKLFLIWIPLLLVFMLATFYTRIPAVWSRASYVFTSITNRNQDLGRVMEVL